MDKQHHSNYYTLSNIEMLHRWKGKSNRAPEARTPKRRSGKEYEKVGKFEFAVDFSQFNICPCPCPSAMASEAWEEEEWELWYDGDFVYKRKKRRQDLSAAVVAPPTSDPEAEQKQFRERRKRALLKLKDQYQREMDQWQHMSHTLQAMDNRAQLQPSPSSSSSMETKLAPLESESVCGQLIDDLLIQAEAQEAILEDLSNVSDIVETLCKAQEERLKQSFIDLPVWATPSALMASLSDD